MWAAQAEWAPQAEGRMNSQQGAERKDAPLGMLAGVAQFVMKGLKVCYGSRYGVREMEGCLGWAPQAEVY